MRVFFLIFCLVLAACGGGGGSSPQPGTNPASEAAGVLDTPFADRGLFAVDASVVAPPSTVREIVPLEDGRTLVGGDGPYILMLTADGELDSSFATNGIDATRRDAYHTLQDVVKIARFGSDRFVVVEFGHFPCGGGPPCRTTYTMPQLTARRIDSRGQVDLAYGDQGSAVLAYAEGPVVASAGGRISAFSVTPQTAGGNYLLVGSLDASGHHDVAFEQKAGDAVRACGPRVVSGISSASSLRRVSAAVSGDKIIVAAQWSYPPDGGICVTRLNADGSLDVSFGADGHQAYRDPALATAFTTFIKALVRGDGEILVVLGTARPSGLSSLETPKILFLTPNGAKDDHPTPGIIVGVIGDAALQPNGKIVIAGSVLPKAGTGTLPPDDWAVTRATPDAAAVDLAFAPTGGGYAILRVEPELLFAEKIALDPYGRILVGGQLASSGRGGVMRFR